MQKYAFLVGLALGVIGVSGCSKSAVFKNVLLEPTRLAPQKETRIENGKTYTQTVLRPIDKQWPSDLLNIQFLDGYIHYDVQGWYPSSGLSVRKIQLQSNLRSINQEWTLLSEPVISQISGKENAFVTGYNYRFNQKTKLPANVTTFKMILNDSKGQMVLKKHCDVVKKQCI